MRTLRRIVVTLAFTLAAVVAAAAPVLAHNIDGG
jgi:hypothetical protein